MEALRRIKRIVGQRQKVGHGGTMDPLARGVLPICLGQATRLMDYVIGGRKRYLITVRLGETTTTYDAEGELVRSGDPSGLTQEMVESTLQSFTGQIHQTPPMYSAIKVKGQRLYKLARAGIEVDREARPVEIHSIKVMDFALPDLVIEVESGKGVYMRSLAHDLGETLGCGAHVAELERLSCGGFQGQEGVTPEQLEEASDGPEGWERYLYPVDWILRDLKSISVGPQAERILRHGQAINLGRPVADAGYLEPFRAYSTDGRFLAVVRFDRATQEWKPDKVFQIERPSPYAPVNTSS